MDSHEVLREAMAEIGVKAVAAKIGLSSSMLYKWCESSGGDEEASGARNPLDRLVELVQITGRNELIGWTCEQAGGFFVRNPEIVPDDRIDAAVFERTQTMIKEFSDLLAEVSKSLENDQGIDRDEATRIRREWEQLKSMAEGFVTACELGTFARREP